MPVMAIVSQGRTSSPVSYDFDTSFNVLSEGWGYWGDGWYELLAGQQTQENIGMALQLAQADQVLFPNQPLCSSLAPA